MPAPAMCSPTVYTEDGVSTPAHQTEHAHTTLYYVSIYANLCINLLIDKQKGIK